MKNLLFYTIAGSVIGAVAQLAGLGIGMVFLLSLTAPPALLIAWLIYKSRGIDRCTKEQYWATKKFQ